MRDTITRAWRSDFMWTFRRSPVAVVSFFVVALLVLSAVFAPLIAPHDPFNPATLNLMNGFSQPMNPMLSPRKFFGLALMTRGGMFSLLFFMG